MVASAGVPMVKLLLPILLVLLVALIVPALLRVLRGSWRTPGGPTDWPFSKKKPLSRVEQVLYYRLVQTLPDLVVLAQVPLPAFLAVRKGTNWKEWFNRISQKSIDFLVCERDLSIVAAIELDDASHDSSTRAVADRTKTRALTAARVPLIRWRTTELPSVETIRRIVDDLRDDDAERGEVVAARIEPSLHVSRIEASNDASIFHQETRR